MEICVGIDEAGRGPLAGPVVAAAVILKPEFQLEGLADSKLLTAIKREKLAKEIRAQALAVGVGICTHREIDEINILRATLLAMERAYAELGLEPTLALVDGNQPPNLPCKINTIIGGDATVPSISAASIIAKVTRDALMMEADREYPGYGFAQHKGYGTPFHRAKLLELGPSPIHRRSFAPVRAVLEGLAIQA